jgi:hypothetical protein
MLALVCNCHILKVHDSHERLWLAFFHVGKGLGMVTHLPSS